MWRAARWLFLVSGALWVMIGVLTPILLDRWGGQRIVFVSTRTDAALFGASPDDILATNLELTTLRGMLLRSLAGLLVASGVLTVGVAWFAMRDSTTWALALLTIVGFAVLPYWWIALAPYRTADISVTLSDIPPFMWVPAILMPSGSVLGWIGYVRK